MTESHHKVKKNQEETMAIDPINAPNIVNTSTASNTNQNPVANPNQVYGGAKTLDGNEANVVVSLNNTEASSNNEKKSFGEETRLVAKFKQELIDRAIKTTINLRLNYDIDRNASFIEFVSDVDNKVLFSIPSKSFYDEINKFIN